MVTARFVRGRRGVTFEPEERARLESIISEVRHIDPGSRMVRAGEHLTHSTLLVDGFLCRYIDDRKGLRQLITFHVPSVFVDLSGYPLKTFDHSFASLTVVLVASVPHTALGQIERDAPEMARKLWFATLLDAAVHRAWLFRLGRRDALGRVAHFLCETNERMVLVGLSDGRSFILVLTQNDLAEIYELTNVHVNRAVRTLREQNLCLFRGSQVKIPDLQRLITGGPIRPGLSVYRRVRGRRAQQRNGTS